VLFTELRDQLAA